MRSRDPKPASRSRIEPRGHGRRLAAALEGAEGPVRRRALFREGEKHGFSPAELVALMEPQLSARPGETGDILSALRSGDPALSSRAVSEARTRIPSPGLRAALRDLAASRAATDRQRVMALGILEADVPGLNREWLNELVSAPSTPEDVAVAAAGILALNAHWAEPEDARTWAELASRTTAGTRLRLAALRLNETTRRDRAGGDSVAVQLCLSADEPRLVEEAIRLLPGNLGEQSGAVHDRIRSLASDPSVPVSLRLRAAASLHDRLGDSEFAELAATVVRENRDPEWTVRLLGRVAGRPTLREHAELLEAVQHSAQSNDGAVAEAAHRVLARFQEAGELSERFDKARRAEAERRLMGQR